MPVLRDGTASGIYLGHEPARNHVVVLVAGVHSAALQAIEYAETLQPFSLRAVSIGLDPRESEELGDQWLEARIPVPLKIEDSRS